MTKHLGLSRRRFLEVTGGATAGLTLGFHVPALVGDAAAGGVAPAVLNAWVRITPDNTVTLLLSQSEMGQGVYTALPMILAEELECDWQKVRVEMAPVAEAYQNPAFHMQGTGGSTSVRAFMQPLRQAGAAAREMLKLAAAKRWGVPVAECHAAGGRVVTAAAHGLPVVANQRALSGIDLPPAATRAGESKAELAAQALALLLDADAARAAGDAARLWAESNLVADSVVESQLHHVRTLVHSWRAR